MRLLNGLNAFAREIHENAKAHGWYDPPPSFPEVISTFHSELSEALEEYRAGKPNLYCGKDNEHGGECISVECGTCSCLNGDCGEEKPQGIAVELADAIIRILDTCAHMGIDIEAAIAMKHEYNKSREFRHGGKKI
ncbi:nucleotide pyrophosphohydrolase [Clostridia bacterium]|nr:nucleotide pyrophosphohydrolase [Clostridia bacterium]